MILAILVIVIFEIVAEDLADGLPEAGNKAVTKLLEDLIGGILGLAVDELDEHLTLGAGHLFENGSILRLDILGELLEVLFALAFGIELRQILLHIGHLGRGDLGNGVDLLDGGHQLAPLTGVDTLGVDEDGDGEDVGDGVALLVDTPILVHIALATRTATQSLAIGVGDGTDEEGCEEQYGEKSFHLW